MSIVPFRSADTPLSLASYTFCQTLSFSPSDSGWVSGTSSRKWFPTTQFLITAFLCLTEVALVGSSTHDCTVRTDPIMRRLGNAGTLWARGVLVPLCARLSNGTSGFFLGAGGGRAVSHAEPTGAPRTLSGLHKFSEHQGGPSDESSNDHRTFQQPFSL